MLPFCGEWLRGNLLGSDWLSSCSGPGVGRQVMMRSGMAISSQMPGNFNEFLGNSVAVESLRTAIAAGRLPHSLILAGPAGAGKYTLALMLAMAVECQRQPRALWSNGQV